MKMKFRKLFLCLVALSLTSCSALMQTLQGGGSGAKPTMSYQSAQMVRSPSTTALLSYYCPSVGVPGPVCSAVLGARPSKQDLRFDFELSFQVNNPYTVPIPTLSMLLATTLFNNNPDAQELGAVCVSFCDPGDASCSGAAAAGACDASNNDIDSLDDFVGAAKRGLVDIATNGVDASNFRIKTIPAQGSSDLKVVFTLGLDPMLDVMQIVAQDHVNKAIQSGNIERQIDIPYSVRGTVWLDLPNNMGRFGLPFGPAANTWQLAL